MPCLLACAAAAPLLSGFVLATLGVVETGSVAGIWIMHNAALAACGFLLGVHAACFVYIYAVDTRSTGVCGLSVAGGGGLLWARARRGRGGWGLLFPTATCCHRPEDGSPAHSLAPPRPPTPPWRRQASASRTTRAPPSAAPRRRSCQQSRSRSRRSPLCGASRQASGSRASPRPRLRPRAACCGRRHSSTAAGGAAAAALSRARPEQATLYARSLPLAAPTGATPPPQRRHASALSSPSRKPHLPAQPAGCGLARRPKKDVCCVYMAASAGTLRRLRSCNAKRCAAAAGGARRGGQGIGGGCSAWRGRGGRVRWARGRWFAGRGSGCCVCGRVRAGGSHRRCCPAPGTKSNCAERIKSKGGAHKHERQRAAHRVAREGASRAQQAGRREGGGREPGRRPRPQLPGYPKIRITLREMRMTRVSATMRPNMNSPPFQLLLCLMM
jgi:hypothetical protein